MNFPKISIVVPSFNQGQFLEETLVSIISQEYPNLELLVVDGGSTDQSVEIIKKYEKHITWWVSEKDKGQSDAINKGFQRATGEIMNWICSDDLLIKGALLKVAACFSSAPADVGLIHGGTVLFRGKKRLKTDWGYFNPSAERNLAGMAFSQPSAFFLRKFADQAGREVDTELHYGMDYELYSRLACVSRFLPVKEVFSEYRLHDGSKSVQEQDRFIGDWNRVFVNLCQNLGWKDVIRKMTETELFTDSVFSYNKPFSFKPDFQLLNSCDKKKLLFYHYCYSLKAFYWSGQLDKARHLLKLLRSEYDKNWLENEKDIPAIITKLALPHFVLTTLKKIKNWI